MFLVLFLFLFHFLQAEHIWFVKFFSNDNHLLTIEKTFPLIDLFQHDHSQSSYIYHIPNSDLTNFARFIHQSNGLYRVLSDNSTNLSKSIHRRTKRWVPSNNPLDESYYENFLSYDDQQQWYNLLKKSPITRRAVRLHTIGYTYENRSLTVIQISTRHSHRRHRKEAIFIDAGMHAREWLSIGVANFLLIQFLRLKETNEKIQNILHHFDIFILPLMNPDGYEYSRNENRLWRKNRSPTAHSDFWNGEQSCYGIDLNRNFPYQWDYAAGSSIHPCSHSYRGPKSSSESEVQSVVKFIYKHTKMHPKIHAYFNLHAYGRFWLLPWTYTLHEKFPNYDDLFARSSHIALNVMNQTYRVGQASYLLYPCSGTSIDFAASLMPHSMTFELSPIFSGLPMCAETNSAINENCTIGFLTGPEAIKIDGTEIFKAIVAYLQSIIHDRFS